MLKSNLKLLIVFQKLFKILTEKICIFCQVETESYKEKHVLNRFNTSV